MKTAKQLWSGAVLATLLSIAPWAYAKTYPEKIVKIVIPTGPGTPSDTTARFIAEGLTKKFNKTFIVESRPGASGTIASGAVHKAAPDGHTLLLTFSTHYINQWAMKTDFHAKDFTPLAQLNRSPIVMSTSAQGKYDTVQDVLNAAKSRPGDLTYASIGGISQIIGAYFLEQADTRVTSVMYKDAPQATLDTANGLTDISFTGLTVLPLVEAGKLKILGISFSERDPQLPDVPTFSESGVPGFDLASNVFMLAPKGVPDEIVSQLSEAIGELARSEGFKQVCQIQMCVVDYLDHKALAVKVPRELEKWKTLVESAGLAANNPQKP